MTDDPALDNIKKSFDDAKPINHQNDDTPPDNNNPKRRRKPGGTGSVLPLGMMGDKFFYIDGMGQFRDLAAKEHNRLNIQGMYAKDIQELYAVWPKFDKEDNIVNWRAEKSAEALMTGCAEKGLFDAFDRVRGIGAWRDENGELILHCGDAVNVGGSWSAPGEIGKFVYPGAPRVSRPMSGKPLAGADGPGSELLELFNQWQWTSKRYVDDPNDDCLESVLLLGWIAAAFLGGALNWRPAAWITGDRSTGKSTLQKIIKLVMAEWIVSLGDATAAGIWQRVGLSAVAIGLDELEAEEDPRQANKVIKLAREAASGSVMARGGSDHNGSQFMARSCFLFSSILVPPLQGQDVSRIACLDLDALPQGATPPNIDEKRLAQIGSELRGRLVNQWHIFDETLDAFRTALARQGFNGRGCDVFGTLLACAHLFMSDEVPSEEVVAGWALKVVSNNVSDSQEEEANHERCLAHLMTSAADVFRGGAQQTVQALIEQVAREAGEAPQHALTETLGNIGLKVMFDNHGTPQSLCIANSHQGLARIFAGSQWQSVSGAQGVWRQAMRRIDGAMAGQQRIGGRPTRCTIIPWKHIQQPEFGE